MAEDHSKTPEQIAEASKAFRENMKPYLAATPAPAAEAGEDTDDAQLAGMFKVGLRTQATIIERHETTITALREALETIEWGGPNHQCPWCGGPTKDHQRGCGLAAALARGDGA